MFLAISAGRSLSVFVIEFVGKGSAAHRSDIGHDARKFARFLEA